MILTYLHSMLAPSSGLLAFASVALLQLATIQLVKAGQFRFDKVPDLSTRRDLYRRQSNSGCYRPFASYSYSSGSSPPRTATATVCPAAVDTASPVSGQGSKYACPNISNTAYLNGETYDLHCNLNLNQANDLALSTNVATLQDCIDLCIGWNELRPACDRTCVGAAKGSSMNPYGQTNYCCLKGQFGVGFEYDT